MFRKLKANEIEARIGQVKEKGLTLLLYKDARVDMVILDETVGALNWSRHHTRDNANCIVSIWDSEKSAWISKEDTGTESNTEKEKGLASDSFKRACVNWGIGRELYTSPFIWIKGEYCDIKKSSFNGKDTFKCFDKFSVTNIGYNEEGIINELEIVNDTKGGTAYKLIARASTGKAIAELPHDKVNKGAKVTKTMIKNLISMASGKGITEPMIISVILKDFGANEIADLTKEEYAKVYARIEAK